MFKVKGWIPFIVVYLAGLLICHSLVFASVNKAVKSEIGQIATGSQAGAESLKLEVGKPIERELRGGETHTYEIKVEAGQYLMILVDQRGIDVVVGLVGPDGGQVLRGDAFNEAWGLEPVEYVFETSGSYQINTASLYNDAPQGRYEIKLVTLRTATENDRILSEAAKLNQELEGLNSRREFEAALPVGERLLTQIEKSQDKEQHLPIAIYLENTAIAFEAKENLEKAEPLYLRALAIFEKVLGPDHPDLTTSLYNLAEVYRIRGDYAKAEPLYQRVIAIWEKSLGPDDYRVSLPLNNLAMLYYSKGDYAKAEPLFRRALEIREKASGSDHFGVALSLFSLARLYNIKGDYAKAEPLYQRAIATYEKADVSDHLDVATALNDLATIYYYRVNYQKAEPLYQRALKIREKSLGPEHPDVADSLNNLALLYDKKGDYEKAEPLYRRALAINEKALGPDHPSLATPLNNLAVLYREKGEYEKAEPLYQRALAIDEKALGPEHPNVAMSLNNLAFLYHKEGEYEKAEPLYQRALKIREKALGSEHPSVASSLSNLAELYREKGEYEKVEPLYQRALAINEKALGPDHPDVANSLNNLAGLYHTKGEYEKAEPLYQRALAINEKALGPDHPDVANSLNNFANLYSVKGDYINAEAMYRRALAIDEKALGPYHPDVANSLNNFANLYYEKGDYAKAVPLLQRSLEIRVKVLGPDHPDVAVSLINFANLYSVKGDYINAEAMYRRALEIQEKALGPDHPGVATSFSNLAALYYLKGDYEKAVPMYQHALMIQEKALGPDHLYVARSLSYLSALFQAKGDLASAITLSTRSTSISERNISFNILSGSERQKLAYLATFSLETNQVLSLHVTSAPDNPDAFRLALTTALRRKGRALDAMSDSFALLRRHLKSDDLALLDQLSQSRTRLSNLLLAGPDRLPIAQYKSEVSNLQEQVEQLEAQISNRSAEFRTQSQPVSIEAIQASIPIGSSLLEFITFYPYNPKQHRWEQRRYLVYILTNKGEPQWADLGNAQEMDNAVAALRSVLRKDGDKPLSDVEQEVKPRARRLDQLVMQPVRKLLGQTRSLLIAPDGALNLVPFAALVDEQNHFLVENYSISYLTTGRDLLRLQAHPQNKRDAIVVANPDFDYPAKAGQTPGPKIAGASYEPLSRLKATQQEATELKVIFPNAEVVTQQRATKAYLKGLSSPMLLHIATHGFFLEDQPDQKPPGPLEGGMRLLVRRRGDAGSLEDEIPAGLRLENPLLRSGLFLTGANAAGARGEEGILTALEVSGLDLWGTKLVVLSACDTGVGEIKDGEGVYGLRRALVLAGSESQMMSLWPVSDTGTSELMVEYYKGLKAGQGRSEALREVQLKMIIDPKRRHPFYWASFIQSGEWANLAGKR